MFGHNWEPGQATIVALKEVKVIGGHQRSVQAKGFEYVADIRPTGGAPTFRTVMDDPFDETHWRTPRVGQVLAVKCDPGRQKAKFDTAALRAEDKARAKSAADEQAAEFDAAANRPPATS